MRQWGEKIKVRNKGRENHQIRVATLCVIPYFFIKDSKGLLHKYVPPSLIMARGIPNQLKIFSFKNLITVL
jgi:hypothetical protein